MQVRAEPAQRRLVGALVNAVELLELVDQTEDLSPAPRGAFLQRRAEIEDQSFMVDQARHTTHGTRPSVA